MRYLNPFCSGTLRASQFLVLDREERSQARKKNGFTTVGGHSSFFINKEALKAVFMWRKKREGWGVILLLASPTEKLRSVDNMFPGTP